MSLLDVYRSPARSFLKALSYDAAPEWRVCFSEDGTPEPTGIAPICPDEGHDPDDVSVYDCCPEPVIECHHMVVADYLAALLNADRSC
ncbi:hypothetical protein [Streptomyces sp. NPDC094049]|uniref:hypothetical protein n=1 Tax=Streptomyces sp. NPDC094049 TaxID=3154987 RepID=UPI0033334D55